MHSPPDSSLATKVWFSALLDNSGLASGYALESLLSPACIKLLPDGTKSRSGRWYKYARGISTPSVRTQSQVDRICPGTSTWLYAPLWKLISSDGLEIEEITDVISGARPHLAKHVISNRRVFRSPRTINSLWKQGDLRALEALLAITQLGAVTEDLAIYVEASWAALHVAGLLMTNTPLRAVEPELTCILWEQYFVYLSEVTSPMPQNYSLGHVTELYRKMRLVAQSRDPLMSLKEERRFAFWLSKEGLLHTFSLSNIDSLMRDYEKQKRGKLTPAAVHLSFIQRLRYELLSTHRPIAEKLHDIQQLQDLGSRLTIHRQP